MALGTLGIGEQINGVNLGNWLVLEKWMKPGIFAASGEADEIWLHRATESAELESLLTRHRDTYITEADFRNIAAHGCNLVRIPVPYFIFGDVSGHPGCIEYLDRAFDWAERTGLKILIDLHTVPGSQNGFDNGGISGVCKWSQEPDEVEFELSVLERLAKRYGTRPGLWGIEILNEPILEDMWTTMDVANRYKPADPEKARGSRPNTMEFIRSFYLEAYDRIRKYMPDEKYVVIHDAFELKAWKEFMREDKYKNVVLDTHQYLMVAEALGCEQTV
ncbi:MAG: cellulase family glycosylhydrolase, partial [Sutterella wadsworthensis]|nr:cellulase family glycosylhydrolase [Sutterella wadsworthensis]